jgi:ribosomal protein S18 acetylase RimI-like enzyme
MHIAAINSQKIQSLVEYLAPFERQALFLLGNILNHLQPSFLYAAQEKNEILGLCGYYPTFQSCAIFSKNAAASIQLAKTAAKRHPIAALLGMADMVKPAYELFLEMGKEPIGSPEKLFFELEIGRDFIPFPPLEGTIRPIQEKDVDAAVLLTRYLHSEPPYEPIREVERVQIRSSPLMFCLELDGKVVSIASTNGKAIKAFQILGVVTDPAYQRRGFAKAVCSHMIKHMQRAGAERAIIFTDPDNIAAKKCYLDLGFKITDRFYIALYKVDAK